MAAKYVRYLIMDYDGVSCRLRGPDHNSRYKKYVDGMLVCCTSVECVLDPVSITLYLVTRN